METLQGHSSGMAALQQEVPAQSQLPGYLLYWSQHVLGTLWHGQWRLLGAAR